MTYKKTYRFFAFFIVHLTVIFMLSGQGVAGPIERTYSSQGPYDISRVNQDGFSIFYPTELDGNHPIITFGNGTGAPTFVYIPLLRHFASWGFIVIDSNRMMTQTGAFLVDGIDYLIEQNDTKDSLFYGKVDTEHIGTCGHSQGGGGAINAAAMDPRVTCIAGLAPSPSGNIWQVDCPMFVVASDLDTTIPPDMVRSRIFSLSITPTVFGIVEGMEHTDFIAGGGDARGYVTAWFMYYLQDDRTAGRAFTGRCEICDADNWTVETKRFP